MVEFCNDKIQIFYLLAPPTQPHAEMNGMRFWNSDCRRWTQNRPKVELKYSVCPVWQLGPIITLLSHVKLVTSSTKFPILKFNMKNYITTLFSVHCFISLKVDSNWHLGKQSLNCLGHIDWWWCSSSPQSSGPGPTHSWVSTVAVASSGLNMTSRWSSFTFTLIPTLLRRKINQELNELQQILY